MRIFNRYTPFFLFVSLCYGDKVIYQVTATNDVGAQFVISYETRLHGNHCWTVLKPDGSCVDVPYVYPINQGSITVVYSYSLNATYSVQSYAYPDEQIEEFTQPPVSKPIRHITSDCYHASSF